MDQCDMDEVGSGVVDWALMAVGQDMVDELDKEHDSSAGKDILTASDEDDLTKEL